MKGSFFLLCRTRSFISLTGPAICSNMSPIRVISALWGIIFLSILFPSSAKVLNFEDLGAIPNDDSLETCWHNGGIFNKTLTMLAPGDVFFFPNTTFHLMGGIMGSGLSDVTFQFEGTLIFSDSEKEWPRRADGSVLECIYLQGMTRATFTSTHQGLIDGNGARWWGAISYLRIAENRPRLLHIYNSTDLLVENMFFKNSPYWTFYANDIARLHIHHSRVDARRDGSDHHDLYDLTAWNTYGYVSRPTQTSLYLPSRRFSLKKTSYLYLSNLREV